MYSREQSAIMRQAFWTRFGKYMAPIPSATGEKVNWVNYKTGISQLYFRMNATKDDAYIGIEIHQRKALHAEQVYKQWLLLCPMFEAAIGESWTWEPNYSNETGQVHSRIYATLPDVNVFVEADWPAIISFLKPRMLALDAFWADHKMIFEMMS